ncbi:MAG: translation initiation factor IF-1 [Candidatus Nealsonbacteria bacterium]|nr:translation initiation factor IF-1 [Candidatus Nealsonbacteria bacterium]
MTNQNKDKIKKSGIVIETLPSAHFKIKLDEGNEIIGHLAGRLRMFHIKILPGDKVTVEMSPYDETKGRITYRGK